MLRNLWPRFVFFSLSCSPRSWYSSVCVFFRFVLFFIYFFLERLVVDSISGAPLAEPHKPPLRWRCGFWQKGPINIALGQWRCCRGVSYCWLGSVILMVLQAATIKMFGGSAVLLMCRCVSQRRRCCRWMDKSMIRGLSSEHHLLFTANTWSWIYIYIYIYILKILGAVKWSDITWGQSGW